MVGGWGVEGAYIVILLSAWNVNASNASMWDEQALTPPPPFPTSLNILKIMTRRM